MQAWSRGECGCGMRGSTEGGVETVCVQMCKAPLAHLSVSWLTQMCQGTEPVSVDATHRPPPVSLLFLPVPCSLPSDRNSLLSFLWDYFPVPSHALLWTACATPMVICPLPGLQFSWLPVLPGWPAKVTSDSGEGENPLLSSPTLWLYRVFTSIELPLITTLRMIWLYYYYLHTE